MENLQIWESSTLDCERTFQSISQRSRNSEMTPTVVAPWILETQALLFMRASKTILLLALLLEIKTKTRGARSANLCLLIQRPVQNKVL